MTQIRAATVDDADNIAKVHVAVWQESYRGSMPCDFLDSLSAEARASAWRERLSNPEDPTRTLVAEDHRSLVAFCTVGPPRKGAPAGYAELQAINIITTAQHQGLGTQLMQAAAALLAEQGFTALTLYTLRDNPAARMFYEGLGGVLSGEIEDEFPGFTLPSVEYRWADIKSLL